MKSVLTVDQLCVEAGEFARSESSHQEPSIYGTTDGKAVGTYFEHKFMTFLRKKYSFAQSSSARGVDFPELRVDMKVTSARQPQSSCPYKNARQKIYGLGYSLLVFVYEKTDDEESRTARLNVLHTIFVEAVRTADFQTTRGILEILKNDGSRDDIVAFMQDRFLPVGEIEAAQIAQEILENPPGMGYLTISNALQWRLQYRRVIEDAGRIEGITRIG